MNVLVRLASSSVVDLDRHLVQLSGVTLLRLGAELLVETDEAQAQRCALLLARAGTATLHADGVPATAGLLPAIATDLAPIREASVIDRVTVRGISLSEAAERLLILRRRPFRRGTDERLRAVLRERDRLYAWRRVVWAPRALLRARALGAVRPVVFDRSSIGHGEERWACASDGALTRWVRG